MDEIKIKIFENDEESLKSLGELLGNKTSRKIIRLLIEQELDLNGISTKLDMQPNLVIHHLQKLEEIGAVQVTHKKIIKKGVDHKFYKMAPGIFILPNHKKEEIEEKGILKKIFKEGIKLTSVFLLTIFGTQFFNWTVKKENPEFIGVDIFSNVTKVQKIQEIEENTLTLPIIILIIGIFTFVIWFKYKKNKKWC